MDISNKQCASCGHHAWNDELLMHVCMHRELDKEQPFEDTCPKWREVRRGGYGYE